LILGAVLIGAIALALFTYQQYLEVARQRWGCLLHDRNAHYLFALNLAQDVRQGHWKDLFFDLEGARIWPPLHGILAAIGLVAGGMDYRLAVVPSLAAWTGTIVFAFLLARRIAPRGGNLAGLVAVAFLLGSPAHRVYATDVMLESLGACLSLAALYLYVVARQSSSLWPSRGLGLALTALFFDKYNYWLLVVAALTTVEFATQPRVLWQFVRDTAAAIDWPRWARGQWRRPGNYLLLAIGAVLAVLLFHGGFSISFRGQLIVVHSPHNLIHAAYIILFIRLAWWWRRPASNTPHSPLTAHHSLLGSRFRQLLAWHGLPIALWFLLPRRLGYWLWYIFANKGEAPSHDPLAGVSFYAVKWVEDYHLGLGSALLIVGLIGMALMTWRRLRPAGWAVLVFLLLAAVLTAPHPNRKSRFLHSWIAAGWVAAGVGVANLVHGRVASRLGWARPWLAAGAAGAICLAHLPGVLMAGYSSERGHNQDYIAASTRDITDFYLPDLAQSRRTTILSSMEIKQVLRWSFLERYAARDRLEFEIKDLGVSAEEDQQRLANWLATTASDTIVFVDVPPRSYFHGMSIQSEGCADRLRGFLAAQTAFQPIKRRHFLHYGCSVTVYRRELR
jgi:hypothetical protein